MPNYRFVDNEDLPDWFFEEIVWPPEGPPTVWLGEEVVFSRNEKTAEIAGSADLKNREIFINRTSLDKWHRSRKIITLAHETAHFCSQKHSHHGSNFLFAFGCLLSSAGMSRFDIWDELLLCVRNNWHRQTPDLLLEWVVHRAFFSGRRPPKNEPGWMHILAQPRLPRTPLLASAGAGFAALAAACLLPGGWAVAFCMPLLFLSFLPFA